MTLREQEQAEARAEWEQLPVHYTFPLTSGGCATLVLPKRLTHEDAERLAAFVASLASESAS